MKRVQTAIVVAVMVLSLSRMAVSQTGASSPQNPPSLEDQMLQAVEKGDFAAVLQLLDKGAHIDAQGKDGVTALIAASAMGKVDIVKQLLAKGASIDLRDNRGDTALNYAVMVNNIDEVKLLLAKGANVNIQEEGGLTPLMLSVVSGSPDIVKLLLDKGANTEARDKNGFTALMAASGGGLIDIVKLLLDRGANINAKSDDGTTALKLAIGNSKPDAEKLLREAKEALVHAGAAGVVRVEMGQDQGVDLSNVAPVARQPRGGLPSADAGVEQQADPVALDVDAVTVRARLQRTGDHALSIRGFVGAGTAGSVVARLPSSPASERPINKRVLAPFEAYKRRRVGRREAPGRRSHPGPPDNSCAPAKKRLECAAGAVILILVGPSAGERPQFGLMVVGVVCASQRSWAPRFCPGRRTVQAGGE